MPGPQNLSPTQTRPTQDSHTLGCWGCLTKPLGTLTALSTSVIMPFIPNTFCCWRQPKSV